VIWRINRDGQKNPVTAFFLHHDLITVDSVKQLAHQLEIRASTGSFIERGQAVRELDMMVRKASGVAKAHTVANFVRMLIEAGASVLLTDWHRDVYDIWKWAMFHQSTRGQLKESTNENNKSIKICREVTGHEPV
jgi:hypothetical protein